jgi:hypothetical protein
MIRIWITSAAFDVIASTLPLGSVGFERDVGAKGERLVWLEAGRRPAGGHARAR